MQQANAILRKPVSTHLAAAGLIGLSAMAAMQQAHAADWAEIGRAHV